MRRVSVSRALRVLAAVLLLLLAAAPLYFAAWITWTDVLPQIRESGLSLTGSNLILNRDWRGNQLYLLVGLYLLSGGGLVAAAAALWRQRGATGRGRRAS